MTRSEVCSVLRPLRPEFHRLGARRLWVFGSRSRRRGRADSDWDFLVDFERPPSLGDFMGLKLLLEDHLHARVDLLSRQACKPRFLDAIQEDLVDVA
ncbi:MAG: nucleotidyltransferase [Planctomycetes bacterium]|nr:nucleotidyltransferase [Planctomycetota bacterium]